MAVDRTAGFQFVREFGEVFQTADGTWLLTSVEAVHFAQRHPEIFSSEGAFSSGSGIPLPLIPVEVDPPVHIKYRKVLDPFFAPRIINAMEDDLRAQVRDLVAAFASRGECDAVVDLARLYPTQVFLTFFGMPRDDRDQLVDWVETILNFSTTGTAEASPEVIDAAMALFMYLMGHIDQKRTEPGDDVLSHVLSLQGEDAWSDDEALGLCFLFCLAGLDTVTGAIGFMMLHLARNPELRRRLQGDPEFVGPFIEEILRLEPPAPATSRLTTRDVEVCGVHIPAGSPVSLWLGTANREPGEYEEPDALDVAQANRGHVTFGGGIHRCLGSHLARRELRLVVEEFHKLIPDYAVAPGFEPKAVWPAATLHLALLPLVFTPADGAS